MNSWPQHINYNGEFYPKETPILTAQNRAFRYGDALFESLHACGLEVQFFQDHLKRLAKGMGVLRMVVPPKFVPGSEESEQLEQEMRRLLHKNRLFQGTRVRLTVFRNDGGLYTPTTNEISYIIETDRIENDLYKINDKGLHIGLFLSQKIDKQPLSTYKTTNALPYTLAAIYKPSHLDDLILTNSKNELVESTSSNLFIYKDKVLYTPPISSGCVAGVMRKNVIELAYEMGIEPNYNKQLRIEDIESAEEIWLTNAVQGVRWVVGYKNLRFFGKKAKEMVDRLNRLAFKNLLDNEDGTDKKH